MKTPYFCINIKLVIILSKIKNYYNSLGKVSRLVFKCTLALSMPLLFVSVLSYHADFLPYRYSLLIIADDLLATARSILTTGLIGAFILNYLEKKE